MENNYKLEKFEAISLIIMLIISKLISNITFYFVNTVGSGAIVNFIYVGVIDFIFMLLLIKLQEKFQNSDIIDISEFIGGKPLKFLVGIISILFLLLASFMTLKDFTTIIQKVYFSNFSIIYIIMFFIIAALVANFIGFKSIARMNLLIIPFVMIAILITFYSIFDKINIRNLAPLLGESYYKTFVAGSSNVFIMYNLAYILFLKPLLKEEKTNFKKISIISYCISWICALLVIIAIVLLFDPTPAKEPANSVFLMVRLVSFGNFIERIDSLFILLCVISIFNYLSFVVFLINRILKKLFSISDEKMLSFTTCSFLLALTLIPFSISQLNFIENTIYRYSVIFYVFILEFMILLMANIKKRIRKGKI